MSVKKIVDSASNCVCHKFAWRRKKSMEQSTLVLVSITSSSALAQVLRNNLQELQKKLEPSKKEVEIEKPPVPGMATIDPGTAAFLLVVAQGAATTVAANVANEICVWLWQWAKELSTTSGSAPDKSENTINDEKVVPVPDVVVIKIGKTTIAIPSQPSEEQVKSANLQVEATIRAAIAADKPSDS
jgi:hypothetical protein